MSASFNGSSTNLNYNFDGSPVFQTSGLIIVAGWFYQTTVSTNDVLYASGLSKLFYDTTTTSRFVIDRATTDHVYDNVAYPTAVTGKWKFHFHGFQYNSASSGNQRYHAYAIDEDAFSEIGFDTNVTGSGNYVASSNLFIGSENTGGSTSINGFASNIFMYVCDSTVLTTMGTQGWTNYLKKKFYQNLFYGDFNLINAASSIESAQNLSSIEIFRHIPLDSPGFPAYQIVRTSGAPSGLMTFSPETTSTATYSSFEPNGYRTSNLLLPNASQSPLMRR